MNTVKMTDYVTVNADGSMLFDVSIFGDAETDGKGYWSSVVKSVLITGAVMHLHADGAHSDLQIQFSSDTWDNEKDGLIYSDATFLQCIKDNLMVFGFDNNAVNAIEYSEQGMQGKYYVSCDAYEFAAYIIAAMK